MRAKSWTIHLRAISLGIDNSWDAISFAGALRAIASRSHNGATSLTLQAGAIFLASSIVSPVQAQLPLLPDLNILDKPEVLGVDDFGSRGVIIRVWIKTQPLKQWHVAREFRRRLKVVLDDAGISIPVPQQEVWFNNSLPMKSSPDGQGIPTKSST